MNVKDYIFGSEIETKMVYHPIEDEKKIPEIDVKCQFHIKGEPMPTPTNIINIGYLLQSDAHNPFRKNKYCTNHKEIEDYINNYYKTHPDEMKCLYFYVTKIEHYNYKNRPDLGHVSLAKHSFPDKVKYLYSYIVL
jgi:hypothetical protein